MQVSVGVMPSFTVTLSDKAQREIPKILRDMLKKQAKDGVRVERGGLSGGVMPKGVDGKRVDLIDTGALWLEARFEPMKLQLVVPYARFVIDKYAAGVSPRYKELFNDRVKKLLLKKGMLTATKRQ